MELVICAVCDTVAQAWRTPLFFQSKAQAVRSFGDAVNDRESDFGRHPGDYVLFAIGQFSPVDGSIVVYESPERLSVGVNLVQERDA